jgi:hypothetical protein
MLIKPQCHVNFTKPSKYEQDRQFSWSTNNRYSDADKKRTEHCKLINTVTKK